MNYNFHANKVGWATMGGSQKLETFFAVFVHPQKIALSSSRQSYKTQKAHK